MDKHSPLPSEMLYKRIVEARKRGNYLVFDGDKITEKSFNDIKKEEILEELTEEEPDIQYIMFFNYF